MSKSQQCRNVQETMTVRKYRRNLSQYETFCLLKRNDGPEAMKEDGRNEDFRGNTAWGKPMRPHLSPEKVKQEDYHEDYPGNTGWGNPMPSPDSQPKANKGQSSSTSSWRPRVREDAASSTHSTGRPGVRLTPAPQPQGDPSRGFQPPSHEGEDMKDHIIQNMCLQFCKDINKLEHFHVNEAIRNVHQRLHAGRHLQG